MDPTRTPNPTDDQGEVKARAQGGDREPKTTAQTDFAKEPIPPRVYLIAVLAGFSGLLYGFDSGAINGALPLLEREWGLDSATAGLVTSLLLYGALPSIVVATLAAKHYDRRTILLVGGVIFILGSILCALSTDATMLGATRFFLGLAIGIANMFGLIYLSELAPTRVRGLLTGLYQLAVNFGILFANLAGDVFHDLDGGWRWMLGLGVVPAVIFFVGMWIAPSSPRFLMMKGRRDEALSVLRRMRGGEAYARKEIEEIDEVLARPTTGLAGLVREAGPALRILLILTFFQVWTGINAVVYYAGIIFQELEGLGPNPGAIASYSVGIALVVSTAVALPLVDRFGRVPMLALSMGGQAVFMVLLTFFPEHGWMTVGCVFAYTFSFGFGLGPVFWLLVPEILPLQARAVGTGVITFSQYLLNAIFAQFVPVLIETFDRYVFLGFGVLSVLGALYCILRLPETSGRSLEEIEEEIFRGKSLDAQNKVA